MPSLDESERKLLSQLVGLASSTVGLLGLLIALWLMMNSC